MIVACYVWFSIGCCFWFLVCFLVYVFPDFVYSCVVHVWCLVCLVFGCWLLARLVGGLQCVLVWRLGVVWCLMVVVSAVCRLGVSAGFAVGLLVMVGGLMYCCCVCVCLID